MTFVAGNRAYQLPFNPRQISKNLPSSVFSIVRYPLIKKVVSYTESTDTDSLSFGGTLPLSEKGKFEFFFNYASEQYPVYLILHDGTVYSGAIAEASITENPTRLEYSIKFNIESQTAKQTFKIIANSEIFFAPLLDPRPLLNGTYLVGSSLTFGAPAGFRLSNVKITTSNTPTNQITYYCFTPTKTYQTSSTLGEVVLNYSNIYAVSIKSGSPINIANIEFEMSFSGASQNIFEPLNPYLIIFSSKLNDVNYNGTISINSASGFSVESRKTISTENVLPPGTYRVYVQRSPVVPINITGAASVSNNLETEITLEEPSNISITFNGATSVQKLIITNSYRFDEITAGSWFSPLEFTPRGSSPLATLVSTSKLGSYSIVISNIRPIIVFLENWTLTNDPPFGTAVSSTSYTTLATVKSGAAILPVNNIQSSGNYDIYLIVKGSSVGTFTVKCRIKGTEFTKNVTIENTTSYYVVKMGSLYLSNSDFNVEVMASSGSIKFTAAFLLPSLQTLITNSFEDVSQIRVYKHLVECGNSKYPLTSLLTGNKLYFLMMPAPGSSFTKDEVSSSIRVLES